MPRHTTKKNNKANPTPSLGPPADPKALLRRVRGLTRPGKGAFWTTPAQVLPGHHGIHCVLSVPRETTQRDELDLMQAVKQQVSKLGGRVLLLSTSRFGFVAGASAINEIAGNQHMHVTLRRTAGRKRKG